MTTGVQPSTNSHGELKACEVCGFRLKPNAVYCTQCERFQGRFRRFLTGMTPAAVVSAIPVVVLAIAFLNTQVFFRHSTMKASLANCSKKAVYLAVSNVGTRPGVISGGTLVQFVDGKAGQTRNLRPTGEPMSWALKPDEARLVQLDFLSDMNGLPSPVEFDGQSCEYRISLKATNFDQVGQNFPVLTCPCARTE